MGNVSDESCKENQITHFVFSNFFFLINRAVYEITLKNTVERGRSQMTMKFMRISLRVPKAINTHYEYVIGIAIPLRQWLHERAPYVYCLSC